MTIAVEPLASSTSACRNLLTNSSAESRFLPIAIVLLKPANL